jgi:streptomycin 6-kinase
MKGNVELPLLEQLDEDDVASGGCRVLGARSRFFADLVGLPSERMLAWGVARSVESALWCVAEGGLRSGEREMRLARVLADAGGL